MTFEIYLSLVLSHSMVYEATAEWLPVKDARGGGDPPAPSASQSTAQSMQAFIKYLPQLMQTALPQIMPAAKAQLEASQATSPAMSQLQADMYKNIAPQLNDVSQGMDASNKLAGSQADLAVLNGPGGDSARAVQGLDKEFNPEFYKMRDQTAGSLSSLMSGGLTPAESEAISRRLNQENFKMGLGGTPTSTSTVSNAMQFGDAARTRQLQGVQAATSFLPASRSGIDPTQVALGRPSINTGNSQFLGANPTAGSSAMDTANGMFNTIAGFQNNAANINANRRDPLDRVTGVLGSLPT